jgi:hypothetical protein
LDLQRGAAVLGCRDALLSPWCLRSPLPSAFNNEYALSLGFVLHEGGFKSIVEGSTRAESERTRRIPGMLASVCLSRG